MEIIERLAQAAVNTNGTFAFRDGKLFGNLVIVVNKCQDISQSDEAELQKLQESNPSLIRLIDQYFTSGPEVILLPMLEWDYAVRPDFNEEGKPSAAEIYRIVKTQNNIQVSFLITIIYSLRIHR